MFKLLYAFLWLITWLPLGVLYILSDFFYVIIYYIVRYRKKVVRRNLENSFPDKSTKEIRQIERKFYQFFCDIFIETVYEMHMSKEEVLRRFKFVNPEIILEQYAKGKSVLAMTAHYGNWEWASALSLVLPNDNKLFGIYKELSNKDFDTLMYNLRMKFTGGAIEAQDLLRTMVRLRSEGNPHTFGMISDQTPRANVAHHWMPFLNQDTPLLTGTEQLAKKFDYPVFYSECIRIKRGYYTCEFIPIALQPKETKEFEITEKYMHMLEKSIIAQPEYWLWSHKRWKHKRN